MSTQNNTLGPLQQDAAFELAYRIRMPQPARPRGLVLLLHGVGGSEMSMATLAAGIDPELLVIAAQAPLILGPGQFGWFQVAFGAEGPRIDADQAEQSRQRLIRFVAQLQFRYGLEAQHTLIAGFSQGGIMSASAALSAPSQCAGFAVLSGRILPEIEPHLAPASALAQLQAFIGHGEYDSKLAVSWAHRATVWLSKLGVNRQLKLYPIDHSISEAMQADFYAWLDGVIVAGSASALRH
uniref:alpha/beta hydrolase n=1 Tax=Marinobacterium profundum TaxID=1714300 RepID=UPI00082EF049|nr:phospholipase [Marinobacterium profundum]